MTQRKRKTLKKQADTLWSQFVRQRDRVCQSCGHDGSQWVLQGAHIIGRRYLAVRFDPDNGMALCVRCHLYFTHRGLEWVDFVGEERWFELKAKAQAPHPRPDYEAIIADLKARLRDVERAA